MREDKLDLYTDYLLCSFGQTTATNLSKVLNGAISHDRITRFLAKSDFGAKDLWLCSKQIIRGRESPDACLIFDDTIVEKAYTDENALISWHYDHCTGKSVKGINLLTAFYHSQPAEQEFAVKVPVSYRFVLKTIHYCDVRTKKERRQSEVSKNEMLREMVSQMIHNQLTFRYVLADTWYASSDNMLFLHRKNKFFVFDMKGNRLAARCEKDRNSGAWTNLEALELPNNTPVKVWLKDLAIPVLVTKQVLTNKDGGTVVRFLVSNDLSLSDDDFTRLYKKRWSVEEYHKSLKQNTSASKSPTRTVKTQSNHLFASMVAYIKLEKIKFARQLNHFALRAKVYIAALRTALAELCALQPNLDAPA